MNTSELQETPNCMHLPRMRESQKAVIRLFGRIIDCAQETMRRMMRGERSDYLRLPPERRDAIIEEAREAAGEEFTEWRRRHPAAECGFFAAKIADWKRFRERIDEELRSALREWVALESAPLEPALQTLPDGRTLIAPDARELLRSTIIDLRCRRAILDALLKEAGKDAGSVR